MSVVRARDAASWKLPHQLGPNVVKFTINGARARCFTVHESLICSTSEFFRARLQTKRILEESECSDCQQPLVSPAEDAIFCRRCGHKFHPGCLGNIGDIQHCPTRGCSSQWFPESEHAIEIEETLNPCAVDIYLQFLYTGETERPETRLWGCDDLYILLLDCWDVAIVFKDTTFKHKTLASLISKILSKDPHFIFDGFVSALSSCNGSDEMRQFSADICLIKPVQDDVDLSKIYNVAFLRSLANMVIEGAGARDFKWLLEKYMNGTYELANATLEAGVENIDHTEDTDMTEGSEYELRLIHGNLNIQLPLDL